MTSPKTVEQAARSSRVSDPELQALEKIGKILGGFTPPVQDRILRYLGEKFLPNRNVDVTGE